MGFKKVQIGWMILGILLCFLGSHQVTSKQRVKRLALFDLSGRPTTEHHFWVTSLNGLDSADGGNRISTFNRLTAGGGARINNWAPVFGQNGQMGYSAAVGRVNAELTRLSPSIHPAALNRINTLAGNVAAYRQRTLNPSSATYGTHVAALQLWTTLQTSITGAIARLPAAVRGALRGGGRGGRTGGGRGASGRGGGGARGGGGGRAG